MIKKKLISNLILAALVAATLTACGNAATTADPAGAQLGSDGQDSSSTTETDAAANHNGSGSESTDSTASGAAGDTADGKDASETAGDSDASGQDAGTSPTDAENEEDLSPFIIWEYEGYVDECYGYTWRQDFVDCDYDGDGKTDRLNRSWDQAEQTGIYTIEFGNGDRLTVPKGWETGFPRIQSGDLDGDGVKEILVMLTYDTSTDPYSFGDMWLFHKDAAATEYEEVDLPLAKGENGAKGFDISYDRPKDGKIHFTAKEAGLSKEEEVGDEYISNWWWDEETTQIRPVYWAEIEGAGTTATGAASGTGADASTPVLRCYLRPFTRYELSFGFNLNYNKGKYEIGYVEIDEPGPESPF